MRITFDVRGIRETQQELRAFSDRRLATTAAIAVTRTAAEARQGVQDQMRTIFDRPTPYALGGIGSSRATPQLLEAEVFIKDQQSGDRGGRPAAAFLAPQIRGGPRKVKGFERLLQARGLMPSGWKAVPGAGARIDSFGNLDRAQLTQILQQLRIGSRGKALGAGAKGIAAQRKAGGRFFAVQPGRKGARPGIYQREFAGRAITPVLVFVPAAVYAGQFNFVEIASRIAQARIGPNLRRAIDESFARLSARGR